MNDKRKVRYHITIDGNVASDRMEESLQTLIIKFVDGLANSRKFKNLDISLEDE